MKKPSVGRTPDEFMQRHDPTHVIHQPTTIFNRPLPRTTEYFIVVAAQNGTPVEPGFWAVLSKIAATLKAEILVIPIRYKNPTSHWSGSQQNAEYWAAEVRPYLWNQRHELNSNLTLLADIKIQPTATAPLAGAEGISHSSSCIIGHTKVQTKTVATPQSRMAKILMTSGACTVPNYTDSRVGRIGEFHHSLSAVLARVEGKKFHLRRLHYDTRSKSVIDLDKRYFADRVERAPRPLALIMGDTHVDYIDPKVERATFGPGGIIEVTKPLHLLWHDLLDGYSCNPHHFGNPFNAVAKCKHNAGNVKEEVDRAIQFVAKRTTKDIQSIVVPSNHDDFLRRWIINNDWKHDPVNAEFYLETALAMVRGTKLTSRGTEYPDPFSYWFRAARIPNARVLDQDESFLLGGVELGQHGDRGPDGARGTIRNLRRIGVRLITGHPHRPGEDEGCTQVGTSTNLRLEYNAGPSSWLNAHALLNADGNVQLLVMVDGEWR